MSQVLCQLQTQYISSVRRSVRSACCRPDAAWEQQWNIQGTADYILERGFSTVTLQLPDELLYQAVRLSRGVEQACRQRGTDAQV